VRAGRAALREQMAASRLGDIKTYVASFTALLQQMWARHCAGDSRRLIEANSPTAAPKRKTRAGKGSSQ
jgi:hypothetical protein